MRIGIDVREAAPTQPGQQRYLWRLGSWLAGVGHDVHFLTVRRQPDAVTVTEGARLHRLQGLSRTRLRAQVRGLGLDVLMLNPERSRRYRGLPANLLRSGYGTEHYVQKLRSFRSPSELGLRRALRAAPWVRAERRWERAFYEARTPPPRVVAQSAYMRGEILAAYDVPEDHVHVVHNAVDPDEFSVARREAAREASRARWGVRPEATCLLFLGHNFRLKGLWQLLRLLPSLPEPIHLLVVGRGTGERQRRKARRLIARYGVDDRVTLAGAVRSSIEALAAADALLHLSWHDSFGFVALEAMACGLPVVTTRYTGAAELIEDGVSGLLVEPEDDNAIRRAIESLRDPATRASIGTAASLAARDHDESSNFRAVARIAVRAAGDGPLLG